MATPSKEEFESAQKLVNSSGGNWGYVTIVIQENDRDRKKWQEAFDRMRELRLIPIVRIATKPIGDVWAKPKPEEIESWKEFLNSLNWVIKDRYIILFNEPNHAHEWEGQVEPEQFAGISYQYAKAFKESNPDYFIMLAGLDMAAASNGVDMDEYEFLTRALRAKPELKDIMDGLSSHAYPNPGFSGSPNAVGRLSIVGYDWELALLKDLGVEKDLPVFITETGWVHNEEETTAIGEKFRTAYSIWKEDDRVRAVTPFILSYQGEPFLRFSWQKQGSSDFYEHYQMVQELSKNFGDPVQIQKGSLKLNLPSDLLTDSTYHFKVGLKNDGQAVWTHGDGYRLEIGGYNIDSIDYFFDNIDPIKPGEEGDVDLYLKTTEQGPEQLIRIALFKGKEKVINEASWPLRILPLPSLVVKTSLFPRIRAKKDREFEVQIFNDKEELVFKQKAVKRENGELAIPEVKNVYLKGTFRVVVLSQYYLPRQTFVRFESGENETSLRPMLPLDFKPDGTFNWQDIVALIQQPRLLGLFIP